MTGRATRGDTRNAASAPARRAAAAAKLVKVGDLSEGLVETASALHVLKLQGRQLALNLSVEQAKPSIQQLLANETQQERFHIHLRQKALDRLVVGGLATRHVLRNRRQPG